MNGAKKWQPILSVFFRYLLGALIVFWLFRTNLIDFNVLNAVHFKIAAVAAGLVIFQLLLAGYRVQLLLAGHGISTGLLQCIAFNSVGIFYSLFLPGGMSGDLARAYCFWKSYPSANKSALFGALFVDRLLGTVAMIVMGLIGGSLLMDTLGLTHFVMIAWIAFLCFAILYLIVTRMHRNFDKSRAGSIGRIFRFIEKIDLRGYGWAMILKGSVLSILGHMSAVAIIFLFSELLGSGLNFTKITAVAPLGLLANALPLTPGGLGIGEKGFELLYNLVGGVHGGNSFMTSRIFLFSPALLGLIVVIVQFIRSHRSIFSMPQKETEKVSDQK